MKIIKNVLAVLLIISTFAGCTSDKPEPEQVLSPAEMFDRLVEREMYEPPYMLDISEERLGDYNVNSAHAESYVAKEAAISSVFIQLIIIEAKPENASDVYDAMTEHRSQLQDDAFYPQGREAAAAAIVGKFGNTVYLICDERAREIEKIIREGE